MCLSASLSMRVGLRLCICVCVSMTVCHVCIGQERALDSLELEELDGQTDESPEVSARK